MLDPFRDDFMRNALIGGVLVTTICGIVGTWVVIRGMAFFGEAIGHGMLPGVAIATVFGWPVLVGGAVSAALMSAAIGLLQRRGHLSYDTSIGLLFVGMLSVGVMIVSSSGSFATDATAMLFGDILAVSTEDLLLLTAALFVTATLATLGHRSFVATAFDRRIAASLGLRPQLSQVALVALVTIAVVASFQAVGTLMVVAMLIAPAVAARQWVRSIPAIMALATVFGALAVTVGLLVSWHGGTAAGSTVACTAVVLAVLSGGARSLTRSRQKPHEPKNGEPRGKTTSARRIAAAASTVTLTLVATGCASQAAISPIPTAGTTSAADESPEPDDHGAVSNAEQLEEPELQLLAIDSAGNAELINLLDETSETIGTIDPPAALDSDGRYGFATHESGITVIDSGVWTWMHGDHNHYYRAESRILGDVPGRGPTTIVTSLLSTAGTTGIYFAGSKEAVLLDNKALSEGKVSELFRIPVDSDAGLVAPFGSHAFVAVRNRLQLNDASGAPTGHEVECIGARGATTTTVGLTVNCEGGAVLITGNEDDPKFEVLEVPASEGELGEFSARKSRPSVAAVRGDTGFTLLDTRKRSIEQFQTEAPLHTASAVDDSAEHVVALDTSGRIRIYVEGNQTGSTDRLVDPTQPGVTLVVDNQRAYLNDPAGARVYEIDFADSGRISRHLQPDITPDFFTEVGR